MKRWLAVVFILQFYPAVAEDNVSIVRACSQLVTDYAFYRDRADADAVADLFSQDATFALFGTTFTGREAIRKRVAAGADGPVYRHMMSTINIQVDTDGKAATGVSYVTVYRGGSGALPQGVLAPTAIGEYHDRFEKTPHGWKISARNFVPVFLAPQDD